MLKYKTVMRICFIEFLVCLLMHIVYAYCVLDYQRAISVAILSAVCFIPPLTVYLINNDAKYVKDVFYFGVLIATYSIGTVVQTIGYGIFFQIGALVAISFFVDPKLNIRFAVVSDIMLIITVITQYDLVNRNIPIAIYTLLFGLYNIIMLTNIVLIYNFRRSINMVRIKANEAINANKSKGDFLANMSHEIRTPLNAVSGLSELIMREEINDKVREYSYGIQNSTRSLSAIINDILDFSKIESGKLDITENEYRIADVINDVVNLAAVRSDGCDAEFVVECSPDIPRVMYGDEQRIRQIITNLVSNALKFTKRGIVSLEIYSRKTDYGVNLCVSVKDTGIGIKEQDLEKLFKVFSQVDTRKNRNQEGTGLGLAISKQLVQLMGGFINVESVYGEGSCFSFTIPQRVKESESFVVIENASAINMLIYMPKEILRGSFERQAKALGVNVDFVSSRSVFMERKDLPCYTHVITARREYDMDSDVFVKLSDKVKVGIICDKSDERQLPKNLRKIYRPLYILPVITAFSDNTILKSYRRNPAEICTFTAPDAKVLIVDDNYVNLKVAKELMKPYGMQIFTAVNGSEAINFVKQHHFDIVFMDHMMPEMDGVEATHIIREFDGNYFKIMPIIALTANAIGNAKEMFLNEGLDDFLAKPIDVKQLDAMLLKWLPKRLVCENEKSMIDAEDNFETANLNADSGIYQIAGNKQAYLEILQLFAESAEKTRDTIEKTARSRDYKRFTIEVHSLKSSSKNIGAEVLAEIARQLEQAGKTGEQRIIELKTPLLLETYNDVINDINVYLAKNGIKKSGAEKAEANCSEVQLLLDKLLEAVNAINQVGSEEVLKELAKIKLNEDIEALISKVAGSVADFDFDEAAGYIERARKLLTEAADAK